MESKPAIHTGTLVNGEWTIRYRHVTMSVGKQIRAAEVRYFWAESSGQCLEWLPLLFVCLWSDRTWDN